MRIATIKLNGSETAAVVTENGVMPVETLNAKFTKSWSTELLELIMTGQLEEMKIWFQGLRVLSSFGTAMWWHAISMGLRVWSIV